MATKIKRSQFRSFLDVTPGELTPDYRLLGDGVTTGAIEYNPEVTTETYIHEDSSSVSVERYAPTFPVEMTAKVGDPCFDFVDGLRKTRATLDDAETTVVNVGLYETPIGNEYPAEQQRVAIAIDNFGGDGGTSVKINFTVNFVGDPVLGTFNPTTRTFTPDSESE